MTATGTRRNRLELLNERLSELQTRKTELVEFVEAAPEFERQARLKSFRLNSAKRGGGIDSEAGKVSRKKAKAETELVGLEKDIRALSEIVVEEEAKAREAQRVATKVEQTKNIKAEERAAREFCALFRELWPLYIAVINAGRQTHEHWADNKETLGTDYAVHAPGLEYFPSTFRSILNIAYEALNLGPNAPGANPFGRFLEYVGPDAQMSWGGGTEYR